MNAPINVDELKGVFKQQLEAHREIGCPGLPRNGFYDINGEQKWSFTSNW